MPADTNQGKTLRVSGHKQVSVVTVGKRNVIHLDYINFVSTDSIVPALKQNMEIYEKWFVHNMKLEFIPTVALTVAGTMHMAPDYDPIDPISPDARTMSEAFGYVGGPITQRLICDMPNKREIDGQYTKGALYCSPSDNDRLASYGFFDVAVEGATADMEVGRLVLHYDVTFIKPCPYRQSVLDNALKHTLTLAGDDANVAKCSPMDCVSSENKVTINDSGFPGQCFSGVLNLLSAGADILIGGRSLELGQRIFFKLCDSYLGAAATVTRPALTTGVGSLNLSRTFDPRTELFTAATGAAETIALRDVVEIFA